MTTQGSRSDQEWDLRHPVIELIRRRQRDGYRPGSGTDGNKLGLAVEGGGMRGIISAAMMTALEDLDLANAIDVVYAASSGATNAAYYLAGESWYPLSIYYDDLAGSAFVDFRRRLRGGDIIDLTYVFEKIFYELKPLNFDALFASPVAFNIAVTLVDELRTESISGLSSEAELIDTLRASTWLPIAVRGTAQWRGHRALDGGVLTAHPWRIARQDGCSHILSLSTRPFGFVQHRHSLMQQYTRRYLNRIKDGLGDGYLAAVRDHWADRNSFATWRHAPTAQPYVLDLAPLSWMRAIKRHETDLGVLLRAARESYAVAVCAFTQLPTSEIARGTVQAIPRMAVVRNRVVPRE
jgi:predicted patatin/cPLA2 family phospholipase